MNLRSEALRYQLTQIIKNLKNSGIEDITTENVTATHSQKGKLVVRFYTEEQWLSNPDFKANAAQIVMGKSFKGCKVPDSVVTYSDTTYLVKVITK